MRVQTFSRGLIPYAAQLSTHVPVSTRFMGGIRRASSMPTVTQPSFWKALIPRPLRSTSGKKYGKLKSSEWNPATFFICIFLLIGSMSIQMISLKKNFDTYMRQSEVRIELLREVVEKIQRGEKVDVEKVLGTGDPDKEIEWQDVLDQIEKDDIARDQKKKQAQLTPTPKPRPKAEENRPQKSETPREQAETTSPRRASFF
ncbi:hypothetical protein VTK73DRAFT_9756 [Phialemonium thermophilum]|uniref:Cell division protein FtsL n=1 Tax=Phialemonium thermophilum TaxID=223376 RepID=A0ABR3XIW3_9PEZI